MIVPKRFVSICARKSDIGVSSTDERLPYPALLITTSSEPKARIAAFTALAAADSSVTSSAKSLIWSPWRSDRSCRDSMYLAVANTLLPAARPASTIARPRPRELPVTNQTCAIHPPIIRNRFLRIPFSSNLARKNGRLEGNGEIAETTAEETKTAKSLSLQDFPMTLEKISSHGGEGGIRTPVRGFN